MEKQKLLNADYLDILYDNRNKTYGGYDLRKKYPDRAKRATYMVLLAAGLLSSIPVIASVINGNKAKGSIAFNSGRIIETTEIKLPHPADPPIKPITKPATAAPIAVTVAVRVPRIVDNDKVPDDAPKPVDSIGNRLVGRNDNNGSPDGRVADNGQMGGHGDGFPDVPPTVDPPSREPMMVVSQMPQFNGDVADYLNKHINYPEQARTANEEGRAVVKFVVNEDGAVSNPEIVRSANSRALDNEALRVVSSMPKWKPGKQQGVAVKVYFNLPITFKLE